VPKKPNGLSTTDIPIVVLLLLGIRATHGFLLVFAGFCWWYTEYHHFEMATPWLRRRLAQDPTMIPDAVLDALLHQRLEREIEQLIQNDFTGQYLCV